MSHPADDIVKSAYAPSVQADEYLLPETPPVGALVKADNPKLVLEALKDGKIRLTCSTWEDARVLLPGQMLGIRREGTFWVMSRIEAKK